MITPKQLLALTAKWLAISVLVLSCTIWLADEISFQYKVHSSNSSGIFATVDMQRMLAIQMKGGKIEYTMDRTQTAQFEPCVYSLFPHAGLEPCWYLLRQSHKPVPLIILPFSGPVSIRGRWRAIPFDTGKRPTLFCFHQRIGGLDEVP
jgi:hypothetical protein